MPQSRSDRIDSDPLLEYSSEPGVEPASTQSPDNAEVALLAPLRERVDTLERSLARATREIATLRTQVATLVAAQRDNTEVDAWRQRTASKPAKAVGAWYQRFGYRAASAGLGLIFGIAAAALLWMNVTASPEPIIVKAAVTQPPSGPSEPPAVVDPAPVESSPAPASTAPAAPVAMTVALKSPARILPDDDPRPAAKTTDYVGTLSIDASPGGEVFVDRQRAGRTPVRLENLKAGAHLIWIERDGYRRWTRVVEVPADRISRAFANLEPIATR